MSYEAKQLRRTNARALIATSEIRGILTKKEDNSHEPFIIWDISEHGLGLWSAGALEAGEMIKLTIAKPFPVTLTCEVRWCRKSPDGSGYKAGILVVENQHRLEEIFVASSMKKFDAAIISSEDFAR